MRALLLVLALLAAPIALAPAAEATHPCLGPDCGIPHSFCPPNPSFADPIGWLKAWLRCRA